MSPLPLRSTPDAAPALAPAEAAIARSVLYAALFDYPLTLSQLRQTLIESHQTPSEILDTLRSSRALASIVEQRDGYFFPCGRYDLIAVRQYRERRSRAFLAAHRPLLRLIGAMPFVRMVALSGSIAHLNLESGGDLDLLIVTRGRRVWSTVVIAILLSKLLGRRRTLCANFIVADTALRFEPPDLFTASQVIGLRPVTGVDTFRAILAANPFVQEHYPNYHAPWPGGLPIRQSWPLRVAKRTVELSMAAPSALFERVCRAAYRRYLRRRAASWSSPEQVTLGDDILKLHTRSHRCEILSRFDEATRRSDVGS